MTIVAAPNSTNGVLFKVAISGTATTISRRTKVTPPPRKRNTIDVTDLDSTDEAVIAGIRRAGVCKLELNIDPFGTVDTYLDTKYKSGEVQVWTYCFQNQNSSTAVWSGIITGYELSDAIVDGLQKATIEIKATTDVAITA